MANHTSVATWDVLQEFGFTADNSTLKDLRPGLEYDFGNFTLSAGLVMNRHFVDVVLFTGVTALGFRSTEVVFELPRSVESREQCEALLAFFLDSHALSGVFHPKKLPPWLFEGRQYKHLLPWEQRVAEYNARPHCTVAREWLKLALKSLVEHMVGLDDDEQVEISFDGQILTFRLPKNLVVVAAVGSVWTARVSLPIGKLKRLPKRFMTPYIDVSVWGSRLSIGRYSYEGIVETNNLPMPQENS